MSLVDDMKGRSPSEMRVAKVRPRSNDYEVRTYSDSKTYATEAAKASYRDSVQSNIGRVQQKNAYSYGQVIRKASTAGKRARASSAPTTRRVLERFQGFVVKLEEEWAHITLITEKGEELACTYPAAELAAKGVRESDRFLLTTIERGDAVHFEIDLIPRRHVSPAEQQVIHELVARELGDYSSGDDY